MLWLILGIIAGLLVYHLVSGSRAGRFRVLWYQWVLGAAAAILFLLALQNYLAFGEELEPTAAGLIWLIFGLPAVILAALIWVIPWAVPALGRLGSRAGTKVQAQKA